MDYKAETKKTYDSFPDSFEAKFDTYFHRHLQNEVNEFLKRIPVGGTILDLGSGAGNHALQFLKRGYDVTCADISEEMIKKCKEKGLKAVAMDFERLEFPPASFDGVWAYTSLLHIPKSNLESVLKGILNIMKEKGILFLGMKEGVDEGFRTQDKYPGTKRWFSLYTDSELRKIVSPAFDIEFSSATKVDGDHTFLNYLLRGKPL